MSDKPKVVSIKDRKVLGDDPAPPVEFHQIVCNCRDWPHFTWEAASNGGLALTCTACGYPHVPTVHDYDNAMKGVEFGADYEGEG